MNKNKKIFYYKNNELIEEINPSFSLLQFFYTSSWGKIFRRLMTRRFVCRLAGAFYDSRRSIKHIQPFIKQYQIDMHDFLVPPQGFGSFNSFFIRTLKPGARSVNQAPNVITSPADGKIYIVPNISTDTLFFVKHKPFNLKKFLGDRTLAEQFYNGTLIIFRLAPYDYHRFHFPVDCIPPAPRTIHGGFDSVNPITFKNGIQPLTHNERQVVLLNTEKFDTIAMVAVGAMMVGKIVHTFTPNSPYKKGDESGYFAFGGSTIVLLFKQGCIKPLSVFLQHSLQGIETAVLMGQTIGEL